MPKSPGTVPEAKLVKAGCGVRYDAELLGEEIGFDFSSASEMKKNEQETKELDKEEVKTKRE